MKETIITLVIVLILSIFIGFILAYNNDLEKTNEQLKKEKYELKQKLEKVEKEKLNCIIGLK